jgi:hypothetical protein
MNTARHTQKIHVAFAIVAGMGLTAACGSNVQLGSENQDSGGAGASGGVYVCPPTVDVWSTVKMGDHCYDADSCGPGVFCTGPAAGSNPYLLLACAGHKVVVIASTLLDSNADSCPSYNPSVSWADCASGLSDGHTNDACTWCSGECARPTDDPCCIEVAACAWYQAPPPPYPAPWRGALLRYRICAPGCQNVQPDTAQPTITDCATVASHSICTFASPCQAGLVCAFADSPNSTNGEPSVPIDDQTVKVLGPSLAWCANGILVGGAFAGGALSYYPAGCL